MEHSEIRNLACGTCDKKITKAHKMIVFWTKCPIDAHHGIPFCDKCDIKYRFPSYCVICNNDVGGSALVQKISTRDGKYITGWTLCGVSCAKEFPRFERHKHVIGWCEDCRAHILEVIDGDKNLLEICSMCKTINPTVLCPRCHFAKYCSEGCRVADWLRHQMYCE